MWLRHPVLKLILTSNESISTYCIAHIIHWCFSFEEDHLVNITLSHPAGLTIYFIRHLLLNQPSLLTFDLSVGRLLLFQLLLYRLSDTTLNTHKRVCLDVSFHVHVYYMCVYCIVSWNAWSHSQLLKFYGHFVTYSYNMTKKHNRCLLLMCVIYSEKHNKHVWCSKQV